MEKRTLLALFLTVVILLVFQVFLSPKQPTQPTRQPAPATTGQPQKEGDKAVSPASPVPGPTASSTPAPGSFADTLAKGRSITAETDAFTVTFNEIGGAITSVRLKDYKQKVGSPVGQELIENIGPNYAYLPTVLTGGGTADNVRFVPDRASFTVTEKPENITFTGTLANGMKVSKTYTLQPKGYTMGLKVAIDGQSPGTAFTDFAVISMKNKPSYIFKGPFVYDGHKLNQIDKVEKPVEQGAAYSYAGFDDGYFAFIWIPDGEKKPPLTVLQGGNSVPVERIALPGQDVTGKLFFGPKKLDILKQLNINAQKIVDFGWFDIIAKPMLLGLNWANRFTRNYGIDIILLTILIKIIFYPLSVKSYKSMKEMQKLQPQIAKLKEKYKDDREKLNREMMDIYKQKGVNPLGGCLPMVIQIPVFFALYKVLMGAIEFRHAPFFGWINDLAAPEDLFSFSVAGFTVPIRLLPLIMGITMLIQQKMTPTSVDPIQEKMMLFMPIVFTFLFWGFPSGLVLYWLVNNVISIAQQYYINQKVS